MMSRNYATALVLACGILAGCGGSSSSSGKSTRNLTTSYDFTENGCATGRHVFSDVASYCSALKNESLNKGCARDLRRMTFERECQGSFDDRTASAESPRPQTRLTPSAPQEMKPQAPPASSAAQPPSQLEITSRSEEPLRVDPRASGEKIMSRVSGRVTRVSSTPDWSGALRLMNAEHVRIVSPSLGGCRLEAQVISNLSSEGTFEFNFIGLDPKEALNEAGCLSVLSLIANTGFILELEKVPVDAMTETRIEKVVIHVNRSERPQENSIE